MPACSLRLALAATAILALLGACAPVAETLEDHAGTVARLEQRLRRAPDDAAALRDLGMVYVRTGHAADGHPYLARAYALDSTDARTAFYLGQSHEARGERAAALALYGRYPAYPPLSPHRRLLEGRYRLLVREAARDEIRALLAQESTRDGTAVPPRTVAVFPLAYQGVDPRYAPLGRGLSEMLTVDLAAVSGLTVVERVRLQVLLDELALGQAGAVDTASAPRLGRLLGAGRVVGGAYTVLGGGALRLDPVVAALDTPDAPRLAPATGTLQDLFQMEKALAFGVLDALGVEPTPEERQRIERVPTENLQAFLAFSRGLQADDAGRYAAAAGFFQEAARLDPGFGAAAEHAAASDALRTAAAPAEALRLDAPRAPVPDLLDSRLQRLNTTLGVAFIPGQESRAPTAEVAAGTGDPVAGNPFVLPDPPAPPGGN